MILSFPARLSSVVPALLFVFLIASCSIEKRTSVKNYPHNKPFLYSTSILLNGNLSKDEKKRLMADLDNYWDDSLKVVRLQTYVIKYTIRNPPVFDSVNIARTKKFMNAYLNSQGYYYAVFRDSVPPFDTVGDQVRATVIMQIDLGKNITIDSIAYHLADTAMQQMALRQNKNSLLKKGGPYTKQIVGNELDRLTSIYRDSGYYRFTRDNIYALVDTTDDKLLQLTLDPFKQASLLAEASRSRKENPQWDISITQRPVTDSSQLRKYYVGTLYFYPETRLVDIPDSLMTRTDLLEYRRRNLVMRYSEGKFSYKPLREHTSYIHHRELYSETDVYKSLGSLGRLGAWQQVDIRARNRDRDTVDLYFFLVPAAKQHYSIDVEGSINTGDITAGNLAGFSTNFTLQNRNVWKRSIQSLTTLSLGTELNLDRKNTGTNGELAPLLQTFQVSLGHSYSFPKLIVPFQNWRYLNRLENKRTIFSTAASYTDRRDFFQLRSLTASLGYEWRTRDSIVWLFRPANIELYKIDTLHLLDSFLIANPFLRNAYRNGNVVGTSLSLTKAFNSKRDADQSHYIRFYVEESGTLLSLFGNIDKNIFNYVKLETEYRYLHRFRRSKLEPSKSEIAARIFAGAGLPRRGESMPVFKQYFLGGTNSMRAWALRQLGLGSSITSDTSRGYSDRYGDLALEANLEYRFTISDFNSFKIGGAIFVDAGNTWNLRKDSANPNAEFNGSRLGRDMAIGIGTGLRFNFPYFLVRLDLGYKLKDPARQYNDGWTDFTHFTFTDRRVNGVLVHNFELQLGIGLPF